MKSPTEYFNQQFHKYVPNQYISNDNKIFNIISDAVIRQWSHGTQPIFDQKLC